MFDMKLLSLITTQLIKHGKLLNHLLLVDKAIYVTFLNVKKGCRTFFDNDERVAADWVANIKQSLDKYTEVDFVGCKVLPR